ncbi:putative B3 domain-containing protein Os04g0676650 [Phragmites australis]|uniref:putative B3 domain-containing protein Os04g0676650 n=1 Tax=Phragmites australis TaxID=29695 RepID=UPI002D7813DB|nr:putative B3 domain-containing protein Os04g0676650 [Phragmites australis]
MADAKGSSAGGAGAGNGRAFTQEQYQALLASIHRTAPSAANVHHQYPAGMIPTPAAMPVPVPRPTYSPQIAVPPPPPQLAPLPPKNRAQSQPTPGRYQSYSPYGNTGSLQYQGGFADWRMQNNALMSFAHGTTFSSSSSYGFHQNVSPTTNTWTNNYVPTNPYCTNYGPATTDVLQAPSFHNNNNHVKDDSGFATSFKEAAPAVPASPFQLMSPKPTNYSSAQIFNDVHVDNLEDTTSFFGSGEIESDYSEEQEPTPVTEAENVNEGNGNITAMNNIVNCRDYCTVLRKGLTNSDVGNIGRIVVPKRDAEANLPALAEKDGMILEMDDLVLPATWKFKFRFWPNNKSRMYVLETTGEFVRRHGLKQGDILIIYKNKNTGRYATRAVKAIQLSSTMEELECECINEGNTSEECGFALSSRPKKT